MTDRIKRGSGITRREFLAAAGGLAALPLVNAVSACAPALVLPDFATGLSLGYTTGDVTPDGALIWLRSEPGASVSLEYGRDPQLNGAASTPATIIGKDSDGTVQIALNGLQPSTYYYFRAIVRGKSPGPIGRFLTAPRLDDLSIVKFCFSGDSREGYQPFTIMDAINANQPNFFVHLGDTVYADRGGTATHLPEFWAKYRGNRDAASQRLFSDTSIYVIWDDHEVYDNYEGSPAVAIPARKAFFDYWPVRRDPLEADRLYRSFRWGRALELFLLDNRQYRDHDHGTMLGERQKEWLFEGIARSSALYKVIGSSVPLYGGGRDRWDGYPKERSQLFNWIVEKQIPGVVFISADLHYAAVRKIPGPGAMKQIVAGPLAAPMNIIASGNSRRFEFFSNKTFNFAMITVDPRGPLPQMTVEFRDENNRPLYKTAIKPSRFVSISDSRQLRD
ncbi:MAG TPA: alkaline phosphatase D family protein [Candidatus Binatia bacterium]|jgi:alkaline phosphatase D